MGFDEMGQLLIMYLDLSDTWGKKNKRNTMRQCIEFKEAHDSVRLEVSLNLESP